MQGRPRRRPSKPTKFKSHTSGLLSEVVQVERLEDNQGRIYVRVTQDKEQILLTDVESIIKFQRWLGRAAKYILTNDPNASRFVPKVPGPISPLAEQSTTRNNEP